MSGIGGKPEGATSPEAVAQARVMAEAGPVVQRLLRKLRRMFPAERPDDLRQMAWQGVVEKAPQYDPSKGSVAGFIWKSAFGNAVNEASREARQSPAHLMRLALLFAAEEIPDEEHDPFESDETILQGLADACHDGAFRMFFGATFETWRTQGEQGMIDHLAHKEAFGRLKSAFSTLAPEDWRLVELRYLDCATWAEVGAELGIGERQSKRRDEEIREKLRRELRLRGQGSAPFVGA
ncbi:MAG: sigma-70 family RNA polymerase sigma factor [Minicystis sp.]